MKIDVNHLIENFSFLMFKVRMILSSSASEVDFNNCKEYCSYLTVSNSNHDSEKLFNFKDKEEIEKSVNFQQLFKAVKDYMKWDSFSILKRFIKVCKSEEATKEVEMFETKLAAYRGLEFIANTPEIELPQNYKKLMVIINKDYEEFKLSDYEEIKEAIFNILETHPNVISDHIRLWLSSVTIVWYVTVQAVDYLTEMVRFKVDYLKKHFVVYIKIGTVVVLCDEVSS